MNGITQLEKYQENWILFRTSSDLLKRESISFENNVGDYSNLDDVEKNKLLVEKIGSIVSAETSKYFTIHQPQKEEKKVQENETYLIHIMNFDLKKRLLQIRLTSTLVNSKIHIC